DGVLDRSARPPQPAVEFGAAAQPSCPALVPELCSSCRIIPDRSERARGQTPSAWGKAFAEIVRTLSSAATIGRPVPCPAGPSRSADSAAPPQAVCGAEESFTSRQRFPWWCGPGDPVPCAGVLNIEHVHFTPPPHHCR